jgi:hypothetical protein
LGRECAEQAREGEERETVNGGQGRRVLTGQGAAGSACAPGKKPGKLVRGSEARYRVGRCRVGPTLGTADVTVSPPGLTDECFTVSNRACW